MDKQDVVQIYNRILLSRKKKNKIMPLAAIGMDLKNIMLCEISHTHIYILLYITQTTNKKEVKDKY